MPVIPTHVRERVAQLGRLSGPLDESRATDIARTLAATLAKQLNGSTDPTLVIGLFQARIESEILDLSGAKNSATRKSPPKLAEVLQTFR